MRFMGIDYGTKKVGIALSDESGKMAFPHSVLKNENLLKQISEIVKKEGVEEIVIGESLNRDGRENEIQELIHELIQELTLELGLPIHLEPEQYSTQEALQIQGRTGKTDASAATIILNSYLTKNKHE